MATAEEHLQQRAEELAKADALLWTFPETKGLGKIPAKGNAVSGKDLLVDVIDPYAGKHLAEFPETIPATLSAVVNDPRVAAFEQAHPNEMSGFREYAQHYVALRTEKAAMVAALRDTGIPSDEAQQISGSIIANVDAYADKHGTQSLDAANIAKQTMRNWQSAERAQFERIAYPVAEQRFVPDGQSEGAMVVQLFLNDQIMQGKLHGPALSVDGQNGKATKELVAAYQKAHALNPTGYVNDSTFAVMKREGLVLDGEDGYFDKKAEYLASDTGKKYEEPITEAIYRKEFAYAVGSDQPDAALSFTHPPRTGFAVAAIQYQMNQDFARAGRSENPLPVDGVFGAATAERLKLWQQDDRMHGQNEDKTFMAAPATGTFDRATYDAFYWDEATNTGLDFANFKKKALTPGSELAKELGPETVNKLNALELQEQARREHQRTDIQTSTASSVAAPIAGVQPNPARYNER